MISAAGTDPSIITQLADASSGVKRQLDATVAQQASGKIAPDFAGLGPGARTSLDLRPALVHVQTWQANIDKASARIDIAQSALKQVADIARDYYAKANGVNDLGTSGASSIAVQARLALQQVAQLLNTREGDVYVFAGEDTANPPIPDTDPVTLGTALLASDTGAPLSPTIGTTAPTVEIGENQRLPAGVVAGQNTLATSQAPTTGSYIRDVMKALAQLATLDGSSTDAATAQTAHGLLGSGIKAMADEAGALGDTQASLATRKTTLASMETALTAQVSDAEDVDLAATLTRITSLQTQLQASYQVIAGLKNLNLAAYL